MPFFPTLRISLVGVLMACSGTAHAGNLPANHSDAAPKRVPTVRFESGEIAPFDTWSVGSHGEVRIAPPNSHPFGRSYGEWVVEWWRWALRTPASVNPLVDPDAKRCDVGAQPGHVRFLGGNFTGGANDPPVQRQCSVPAGTAFFFPVLNGVYISTPKPKRGCTVPPDPWYGTRPGDPGYQDFIANVYRVAGVDPDNPRGSLRLTIDGKPICI